MNTEDVKLRRSSFGQRSHLRELGSIEGLRTLQKHLEPAAPPTLNGWRIKVEAVIL